MRLTKRSIIIYFGILIIIGTIIWVYNFSDNEYIAYWKGLPSDVKWTSVALEIERPFYQLFNSEISHKSVPRLERLQVLNSIKLGADWICSMQENSGRFHYWFDPSTNKTSPVYEDNFLRQAGTAYSLMVAYETEKNSTHYVSALQSLYYLNQFKQMKNQDTAYYLFNKKAKLGGIALPMLVMLELKKQKGSKKYDQDLKALANMVLYLQDYENNGAYKSTYVYRGDYQYEKTSGWVSNIYPGEAMLAMIEMYKAFDGDQYLESVEKAYNYYTGRKKWVIMPGISWTGVPTTYRWKNFSFVPWTTMAMVEAYLVTNDKKYADFAFDMADYILYWQNLNPNREAFGSLFGLPSVFSSPYLEAIGEVIKLAGHMGLKEKSENYSKKAIAGYNWLMSLQYTSGSGKALGGFKKTEYEPSVRIDNTQHTISALVRGIKYDIIRQ